MARRGEEIINPLNIEKSHIRLNDKSFTRLEVLAAVKLFFRSFKSKNLTRKVTGTVDGYKYEITMKRRKV